MLSDQLQLAKKLMSDRPRASGFCYWASEACCKLAYHNDRSRPSDKGEGGGHPDPEIRGRGQGTVSKNFFWLFGPQFDLKIRGWGGGAGPLGLSPRSTTVSEELLLIKSFLGWLK